MVNSSIKWMIPLFIISYLWFTMVHPLHGHCRGLATRITRWGSPVAWTKSRRPRPLSGSSRWPWGAPFSSSPWCPWDRENSELLSRVVGPPPKKGIEASNIRIFVDPWIDPWISIKHVQTLGFNEWNTFRIWINHPWRIVIQKYGCSIQTSAFIRETFSQNRDDPPIK